MPGIATPHNVALKEYLAHDNGDGTFTVHDVELVGPMPEGDKPDSWGEAPSTGSAWMRDVIANHLAQLVGGFVAPVHGEHGSDHGLGTFVPTGVRRVNYEGESTDFLFGDLTVTAAVLAEIQSGLWPYRSIEIGRWADKRITSLALMKASGPYWRVPILKRVRVVGPSSLPDPTSSPELASLFAVMPTARAKGYREITARQRVARLAALSEYQTEREREDEGGIEFGGGDAPASDAPPARGAESPDGSQGEQSGKLMASMMTLLTKIYEAIVGAESSNEDRVQPTRDEDPNDSGEPETDADEADEGAKPTDGPKKEKAAMSEPTTKLDTANAAALAARLTKLEGEHVSLKSENATLKADLAAAKADSAAREFVTAGERRLRAKRVVVPAKFGEAVAKLHRIDPALAEDHVATLEANGRQDPPETFLDEIASAGSVDDSATPELAPYRQAGAAQLERGLKVAKEHRALLAQCPGSATTLAEMLKINAPLPAARS